MLAKNYVIDSNRIFWCDFVRGVAILLVVLNHSVEYVFDLNTSASFLSYTRSEEMFSTFFFGLGRLGVPSFLFLTGYLILSKDFTPQRTVVFYKHNLLRMILTMEVWMVFLDVFVHLVNPDYSLSKMIAAAFFVKAVPYMQMWYVPFIVGVYIGLPFLACIVKSFPGKMLAVFFAALSIIILLLPTIGIFFMFRIFIY